MRKLLQLKMYSFLSSRWGMTFCVVGLFVTLNMFFQIVQLLISREGIALVSQEYSQNVGGKSYQHIMCADPIDIVYTWVNGSDPKHKKAVADYKRLVRDPNVKACNQTQVPDKDNCFKDEDTASRFIDNEELRYSLRSIEKFAPWVRHIFLVTNGQVPSWINTEHPRLTVITHAQIFTNVSHLPTFSSPSIEVHLHRIPGLSKKFIYMNDDVMFGRDVYPDDFYTLNAGQKVFLSWAVPNCAEGCPPNWVGDGYCDLACNVSACDFDAHDCDNYTGPASRSGGTSNNRWWGTGTTSNTGNVDSSQRYKNYCSKGCPDSWIGDKYCDRMCKNLECAFDAGDCGVEDIFGSMHGIQITNTTRTIALPSGLPSVYFNLTEIVGGATITDGSHDNVELVRTATISQKFKIMTLTFHRNITLQDVMLSITAENITESGNKTIIEKIFNITLDTVVHPSNETTPGEVPSTNSTNPITSPGTIPHQTSPGTPTTKLASPGASTIKPAAPELTPSTSLAPKAAIPPNSSSSIVSLEPAQQPPKDAAIESNIKSGAGGLPEQSHDATAVANRQHETSAASATAPESAVPVELQVQPQSLRDVQSAAISGPDAPLPAAAQPKTTIETPPKATQPISKTPPKAAEPQTTAPPQPATSPDKNLETDTNTAVAHIQAASVEFESLQTDATAEGRPEARQPPGGYDSDHDAKGDHPQRTTEESSIHNQPDHQQQSNDITETRTKEGSALRNRSSDSEKHQPARAKTLQDMHKGTGEDLEWLQLEKDAKVKTDENSKTSINGGSVPESGGDVQNLEQKFVLADPDAGDSSGALKAGLPELRLADIVGDGAVPQNEHLVDATKEIETPEATEALESPAHRNTAYRGSKASKNDHIKLTKNQRVGGDANRLDKTDEAPTNPKSEADQGQGQDEFKASLPVFNGNNKKRSILSIPIYDAITSEGSPFRDVTPRDKQDIDMIPDGNVIITTPTSSKPPVNAADYTRWWDMMTVKKKLDVQQMEQSKKELEELENKLQQNRDLDKRLADSNTGVTANFPWEDRRWALYETKGGGRKLLDDFADSLKHVNKLFTQAFGPSARKVPAHMPHMIDRDIMEELQSRWPNEWNATSSHRLRSGKDMQYAFAYFYYLIHARVDYNLTNVWRTELDMDKDGELSDNELRTLAVHLHGAPLKPQALSELKERLVNTCLITREATPSWKQQPEHNSDDVDDEGLGAANSALPHCSITLDVLANDNKTSEDIKKVFSKKLKYRHQIEGTDEVAFLMIGNNDTVVQGKLDGIRTKRQKFICLNDNMNHSSPDTLAVVRVLHDLYTALLPLPCSFELPPNVRNAYLYIDDINAAKTAAKLARRYEMAVGIGAIVLILGAVYRCRKYAMRADRRVRERRAKRLLNSGGIS